MENETNSAPNTEVNNDQQPDLNTLYTQLAQTQQQILERLNKQEATLNDMYANKYFKAESNEATIDAFDDFCSKRFN